jgi:DNA-directed RNA polymerase specialized sigma24 family protein
MNDDIETAVIAAARKRFDDIIRSGALRVCERTVHYSYDREDRVQEGLASAWRWYAKQAQLGNTPDTALVVHACRLRTVDRGRRFVCGDRARWSADVFVQQERGLELRRLDGVHDHDDDGEHHEEDPSLGIARLGIANPETNIASALDLSSWLNTLASTDREMVAMRGAGFKLEEISKTTGRSVAGVFRRTRQLGLDLAQRAGIEVQA